jgi:WD40 repeat protein
MSAVALIPPSPEFPEGLVASGSRDGLIDLRSPASKPELDPDAVLIGHANNVCALDVSQDGKFLVSGSWDQSARVWEVGKWEPDDAKLLSGHEGTVWAVLALNSKVIVTGICTRESRTMAYRTQARPTNPSGYSTTSANFSIDFQPLTRLFAHCADCQNLVAARNLHLQETIPRLDFGRWTAPSYRSSTVMTVSYTAWLCCQTET